MNRREFLKALAAAAATAKCASSILRAVERETADLVIEGQTFHLHELLVWDGDIGSIMFRDCLFLRYNDSAGISIKRARHLMFYGCIFEDVYESDFSDNQWGDGSHGDAEQEEQPFYKLPIMPV